MTNHLFCFGYGYSAQALAGQLTCSGAGAKIWKISGTSRNTSDCVAMEQAGITAYLMNDDSPLPPSALDGVSHLLSSVPPTTENDPVLEYYGDVIAKKARQIHWASYLSTTGVYGNRDGDWVNEDSTLEPTTERGVNRVAAEHDWLALYREHGLPVHVFRLASIYGPGRNQLHDVVNGKARQLIKPGQVFSRIHVTDIAGVLAASINQPNPGTIYNLCDDHPAPPQEVTAFAARILGQTEPKKVAFENADLSPMARSFYSECKRVSNARIKSELNYKLQYPNFRDGLSALMLAGDVEK